MGSEDKVQFESFFFVLFYSFLPITTIPHYREFKNSTTPILHHPNLHDCRVGTNFPQDVLTPTLVDNTSPASHTTTAILSLPSITHPPLRHNNMLESAIFTNSKVNKSKFFSNAYKRLWTVILVVNFFTR